MPRTVRKFALWVLAATFVFMIVLPWLAGFFTDWLWFSEVGFRPVFVRSLVWRVVLFVIGGVVAYLVFATAFGGEAFRVVAAIGILALGVALTVGGLADRLSRKSPA